MWTECVWPYTATGTECVCTECLCVTVTCWREKKTPSVRSGIVSQTEGSCACIRSGRVRVVGDSPVRTLLRQTVTNDRCDRRCARCDRRFMSSDRSLCAVSIVAAALTVIATWFWPL